MTSVALIPPRFGIETPPQITYSLEQTPVQNVLKLRETSQTRRLCVFLPELRYQADRYHNY